MLKKVPAPSSPEQLQDGLPPLTIPSPPSTFDHAPFGDDGFQVGDFVKILSDAEAVKLFQTGHGEWVESMIHVREGEGLAWRRETLFPGMVGEFPQDCRWCGILLLHTCTCTYSYPFYGKVLVNGAGKVVTMVI